MIQSAVEHAASMMGCEITDEEISALVLFVEELKKWSSKINLTAIRSDKEIAVKHIVDSLYLGRLITETGALLDVGSGAGIPAIPLKIIRPNIHVVSVDATAKKIHFQRHVARLLDLQGFEARHRRIESISAGSQERFDIIISRAFANIVDFAKHTYPLLTDGGLLVAMKGPAVAAELEKARAALKSFELEIVATSNYNLPFDFGKRSLITMRRIKCASETGVK